jgi:uncharacterized protein YcbX
LLTVSESSLFMPIISALYIYPVKSLAGIEIDAAEMTPRGLQYDRRWMLVDEKNQFLTQREFATMALLKTAIVGSQVWVHHIAAPHDKIAFPLVPAAGNTESVQVWDDECMAQVADKTVNEWFSKKLGISCKAVYMPEESLRPVDSRYAKNSSDITSFSDAYPILMISEASLQDLNDRLEDPVPMDRFRPNIVISQTEPYAEDAMKHFLINDIDFYGVKLCSRCVVTTTDQQTGERNKEPLKTLATYRNFNGKVCFGQNIICGPSGRIQVNDTVLIVPG